MNSDQLVILGNNRGKFEIHYNKDIGSKFEPSKATLLKEENNQVAAIKFANKYCEKNKVSHGYHFVNPNEIAY